MLTEQELKDEIDRCLGPGPAHRPVTDRVAAGRRALLRRRAAVGAVTVAAVVVVGTGYAIAGSPGGERDNSGPVATAPAGTASASPDPTPSGPTWKGNGPVRYLDDRLQVRPGVTVHQQIENPYRWTSPNTSDALDLTVDGRRTWVMAEYWQGELDYAGSVAGIDGLTFEQWVAQQAKAMGAEGFPTTMRLSADGDVVAAAGTEVLQRTDEPDLGPDFAPEGAPTGAAVVVKRDQSYFVVWRVVDGELDVITAPPADVVGASFEELLNYARGAYASGKGLR